MSEQFEQDDREALLAATAEALAKYPPNHLVDDPTGETGYAESDPYGYDETAREAFVAGALFESRRRRSPAPQQVSTVEELDALDHRTYVQGYDGFGHVKHLDHWVLIAGQGHAHDSDGIALPATVLYRPEGGESDE